MYNPVLSFCFPPRFIAVLARQFGLQPAVPQCQLRIGTQGIAEAKPLPPFWSVMGHKEKVVRSMAVGPPHEPPGVDECRIELGGRRVARLAKRRDKRVSDVHVRDCAQYVDDRLRT